MTLISVRQHVKTVFTLLAVVLIALPVTTALADDDLLTDELDDLGLGAGGIADPTIVFHLPLDDDAQANCPAYSILPSSASPKAEDFVPGRAGKALRCHNLALRYVASDFINRERGTILFWFKWEGGVNKNKRPSILNAALSPGDVSLLNRGDNNWHQLMLAWDQKRNQRNCYIDGNEVAQARFGSPFEDMYLSIANFCPILLDDVYVLDAALEPSELPDGLANAQANSDIPSRKRLRYPLDLTTATAGRGKATEETPHTTVNTQTETRQRMTLDGWWRVQPFGYPDMLAATSPQYQAPKSGLLPEDGDWGYCQIPGSWRPHGNNRYHGGVYRAPDAKKRLKRWRSIDTSLYPGAWLERDFALVDATEGEGVFLVIDGVNDGCDFYINGHWIARARPWSQSEHDISEHVRFNGSNRVTILAGHPSGSAFKKERDGSTTYKPSGPSLSVHIERRRQRQYAFADVIPIPSFRERALDVEMVVANPEKRETKLNVTATVHLLRTGEDVSLGQSAITLTGEPEQVVTATLPWPDPELWFPDAPKLCNLSLSIADGDKVIDQLFPVRFGFREVWSEGGDLYMNGQKFTLRGQCHSFGDPDPKKVAHGIDQLRKLGMNSSILYFIRKNLTYEGTATTLKVCDEKGFLLNVKLYWNKRDEESARRTLRSYMRIFRGHPSVVLYNVCRYSHHGPNHGSPISMGRAITQEEMADKSYQEDIKNVELAHEIAPGCLVGFYQAGLVGDYRTYMQYMGWGTPIQTHEEWPRYWSSTRPVPFVGNELDLASNMYLWKWQGTGFRVGKSPFAQAAAPLVTEHAARYFGDAAYAKETMASVAAIDAQINKEEPYEMIASPNYDSMLAPLVERKLRAWRTWGISYLLLDDQRIMYRTNDVLTPTDLAYQRNNGPVLAYIAGPESDFSLKDHAFYGKETIAKQAILFNDRSTPGNWTLSWSLAHEGEAVAGIGGEIKHNLAAGEQARIPFNFVAPEVNAKKTFKLSIVLEEGEEVLAQDQMQLEVFPAAQPLSIESPIWLLDQHGSGQALLNKAGVTASPLQAKELGKRLARANADATLIIARNSLPNHEQQQQIAAAVRSKGLSVLCLEQEAPSIFGLRNDDPNTRHAFISSSQHPVCQGLSDLDFRNWRGASDSFTPYPDYRDGVSHGTLDHHHAKSIFGHNEFAHWSSNGTVASFYLERPQTGRFTSILSSGFDMLYTPLGELELGAGRIVFCQLDVSNRYASDPVATLVVNRLLTHLAAAKNSVQSNPLHVWGESKWHQIPADCGYESQVLTSLSEFPKAGIVLLGVDVPKAFEERDKKPAKLEANLEVETSIEDDELTLDDNPKNNTPKQALSPDIIQRLEAIMAQENDISTFVNNGGTLIIGGASDAIYKLKFLNNIQLQNGAIWKSSVQDFPLLAGCNAGDFYFRKVLKLPLVGPADAATRRLGDGLFAELPYGKGRIVIAQLHPAMFNDPWQQSKIRRIYATLFRSLGVKPADVDLLDSKTHYPLQALDFNPDRHRSW